MKSFTLAQRLKLINSFKLTNDYQLKEIIDIANNELKRREKRRSKKC